MIYCENKNKNERSFVAVTPLWEFKLNRYFLSIFWCLRLLKFLLLNLSLKIYSKTFFQSIKSFRLFLFPIIEFVLHLNLILLKSNKKFLPALISIHFFAAKWKTFANALDFSLIGFLFFSCEMPAILFHCIFLLLTFLKAFHVGLFGHSTLEFL